VALQKSRVRAALALFSRIGIYRETTDENIDMFEVAALLSDANPVKFSFEISR